MVTFECPWCAEPASVDSHELDELTCEACGLQAELAPDPIRERIAQAA
jgi:transcription elongation factor Elf1